VNITNEIGENSVKTDNYISIYNYRIFKLLINQTRGSVRWACVAHFHSALRKLNTEPSIDLCFLPYLFHSALRKLNTEPSIDLSFLSYLFHLAARFQRRRLFRNRPNATRNKNCLWWPCLLTNREELSSLYRGPSKDASYQISLHFGKRIQRRIFLKKSTNQKQELPVAVMFVNGLELNDQIL
jgi:hypothetical protein